MRKFHLCEEKDNNGKPQYWLLSPYRFIAVGVAVVLGALGVGYGVSTISHREREKLLEENIVLQNKLMEQQQLLQETKDMMRHNRSNTILTKQKLIWHNIQSNKIDTIYYITPEDVLFLNLLPDSIPPQPAKIATQTSLGPI